MNVGQLDVVVRLLALGREFEAEYCPDESYVFSRLATWECRVRTVEEALERHLR